MRISYAVSDEVIERSLPGFRRAMEKVSGTEAKVRVPGS
jgi:hypothetical protein